MFKIGSSLPSFGFADERSGVVSAVLSVALSFVEVKECRSVDCGERREDWGILGRA
jgi:hypothetical protein